MKKLIESIDKLSAGKTLNESTNVTDYNPPSQGGTRKELLATLRKTKDPKDATKARKAGATQKELQDAMKGVMEESGAPTSKNTTDRYIPHPKRVGVKVSNPDYVEKPKAEYVHHHNKKGVMVKKNVAEVSDATLTSYLTKLDKDNLKHRMDPTKRSDTKRMKSGPNFVKAFTKLDNRKQGVAEGYSNTTFQTERKRLNVPALIKAGALFVTCPHGEQGWETDNQEDWAYSLISLYNVMQGGWSIEAKKYLKPASYKKAEQQINSSAPNLGSDKLVYDGKYNQILWSIKKLGIPDNVAFLDNGKQGVAEGYFNKDEEDNQNQMDANRKGRLNREREPSGSEKIDARLRAQNDQLAQYNQSGKFWLKQKDTQEHLSDSFVGKQAANAAAVALLKQRPELKGNLVITAYGPGETQGVAEAAKWRDPKYQGQTFAYDDSYEGPGDTRAGKVSLDRAGMRQLPGQTFDPLEYKAREKQATGKLTPQDVKYATAKNFGKEKQQQLDYDRSEGVSEGSDDKEQFDYEKWKASKVKPRKPRGHKDAEALGKAIDREQSELRKRKEQGVAEGVSLKQKHEDKKRADQNQVRYGKMTQAEFDKKWTRTERPNPTDKKQGVSEGVAETLTMDEAKKVLRQYGADNFKTTSNELHFYKNGRPMSVGLTMDDTGIRHVNLSQLNSATRKLKGQGIAEGIPDVDHMPGPIIKRTQTGCKRCHGKGFVYKTPDGETHPMNRPDAKKYKCGKCNGIGFVKLAEQGVSESKATRQPKQLKKLNKR